MGYSYLNLLPAAGAVINGFIAVMLANFFQGRQRARFVLVLIAGAVAIAAIGATFYSLHSINVVQKAERLHRLMIREEIGKFIKEGEGLLGSAYDTNIPIQKEIYNDWETRVTDFLRNNLGPSYVVRFDDTIGVTPMFSSLSGERNQIWMGMYARLQRLEQFSEQLPL